MTPDEISALRIVVGSLQDQLDRLANFLSFGGVLVIFGSTILAGYTDWLYLLGAAFFAGLYFLFARWYLRKSDPETT